MKIKAKKRIVGILNEAAAATDDVRDLVLGVFWPFIAIIIVVALAGCLWFLPIWEVSTRATNSHLVLAPKDRLDLENSARTTLVQFLGGAIVLVGSYIAFLNVKAVEKNVKIAQDGQITERYTRAIEQLGSDKPEIRLGGIYALERIARDSERDHGPIMEVLASYVRSHRPPNADDADNRLQPEVQAIMTVIGRRAWIHEIHGSNLDFRGVHLQGLDLRNAYLGEASFDQANLDEAVLVGAELEGASFVNASLQFAKLRGVSLGGVDLKAANLAKADLSGCDLRRALNLTATQVSSAIFDERTVLPEPMRQELTAIWRQANEGLPKAYVDTAQAAALGIRND